MPPSIPLVTGSRAAIEALMPLVEALISEAASRVDRSVVLMPATVELIDLAVALIDPAVSRAARTDDSIDLDCVSIEPDEARMESTLPRIVWARPARVRIAFIARLLPLARGQAGDPVADALEVDVHVLDPDDDAGRVLLRRRADGQRRVGPHPDVLGTEAIGIVLGVLEDGLDLAPRRPHAVEHVGGVGQRGRQGGEDRRRVDQRAGRFDERSGRVRQRARRGA